MYYHLNQNHTGVYSYTGLKNLFTTQIKFYSVDGHGVKLVSFHSAASATATLIVLRGHIAWEELKK